MSNAVTLEIRAGVADLRLNRPDKMNAVDEGIMTWLYEALVTLRENKSVRVVVLSGNGKAFC